jgi:methyl-accepting chemotaxis protein
MTLARRLYLLICTAALGLVGLAALGYYQIENVYTSANYGNVNTVPSLKILDDLRNDFLLTRSNLRSHILSVDNAKKAEIEAVLKSNRDGVAAALKQYLAPDGCLGEACVSDDKDKGYLKEIESLWGKYDAKIGPILVESTMGERGIARARDMLDTNAPLDEKISATIDADFAYNLGLSKKATDSAAATKVSAVNSSITIAVLVLVVVCVMGFLIVGNVQRQLGGEPAYAANVVSVIAQGNLTDSIAVRAGDTTSLLAKMQGMQTYLRDVIDKIHHAAEELGSASKQLASTANQVADSASQQSESSSSMAAAVEELTVSINHVSENAKGAHLLADEARKLSLSGEQQVQKTIADIHQIASAVGSATQSIHTLGEQSDQISGIVNVINEIADQTNLLALNAAIEAARAGEQGRGFAVVADEVRKLAEKTTRSTQEISGMISAIQQGTQTTIKQMAVGTSKVQAGVDAAASTGGSIREIEESARKVLESVNEISSALSEQSSASNEIAKNVERTAQLTEENGAAVNEVSRSAEHLDQLARTLKVVVSRFQI